MTDGVARTTGEGTAPAVSERAVFRTDDPVVLRAFAHPLRVELLAQLDELGEATASELGELTGQSVANASFHLRQLEKAGFIERAAATGREKPWRPAHRHRSLEPDPHDARSVQESGVISAAYLQHEATRLARFFATSATLPPEWVSTVTFTTAGFWATAEELRALGAQIQHLVDAFAGRGTDPALRPEGAVHARLLATLNPELDHEDRAGAARTRRAGSPAVEPG
ncbi:winged helix-turn-helix domain-containing protein [Luteimicrobium subarcticum]|uniref:Helix-turn-helix protein n=1 Tax=Luteimicrobium subarcticum TaxID=620910 RepID=A0A2M8WVS4_9MICO|nr:winged helix-turn-helix domain-containing protein [Luteimicrobium subarcticum]PJI95006.1 helix-turn-helix protein [Luteimicrobium subarcticum]